MFISLFNFQRNLPDIPFPVLYESIFFFGIPKFILFPTNQLHLELRKKSCVAKIVSEITEETLTVIRIKDQQGLVIWMPSPLKGTLFFLFFIFCIFLFCLFLSFCFDFVFAFFLVPLI